MGDRANIIFKQSNGSFLGTYMHQDGYRVKQLAAKAIQSVIDAGRQNDENYANRIAISQIVGDQWNQAYSFGVTVGTTINEVIIDNERDVVVIDWAEHTVSVYDINDFVDWHIGKVSRTYTFDEFARAFEVTNK